MRQSSKSSISSREIIVITLYIVLSVSYVILSVTGHEENAKTLGQLLTVLTVAVASYYLGYTRQKKTELVSFHLEKKYVKKLGYVLFGFGIGLLLQHIICHGIDLTPATELLVGHEWIGLYSIIASMLLIWWSK